MALAMQNGADQTTEKMIVTTASSTVLNSEATLATVCMRSFQASQATHHALRDRPELHCLTRKQPPCRGNRSVKSELDDKFKKKHKNATTCYRHAMRMIWVQEPGAHWNVACGSFLEPGNRRGHRKSCMRLNVASM